MRIVLTCLSPYVKCGYVFESIDEKLPFSERRNHLNANIVRSNGSLAVSHASQSDLVVLYIQSVHFLNQRLEDNDGTHGNSPIPLTFHTPIANAASCIAT